MKKDTEKNFFEIYDLLDKAARKIHKQRDLCMLDSLDISNETYNQLTDIENKIQNINSALTDLTYIWIVESNKKSI